MTVALAVVLATLFVITAMLGLFILKYAATAVLMAPVARGGLPRLS